MKTSKQKRFAAIFAGMLCISCLTAPFSATAETADTAGENPRRRGRTAPEYSSFRRDLRQG